MVFIAGPCAAKNIRTRPILTRLGLCIQTKDLTITTSEMYRSYFTSFTIPDLTKPKVSSVRPRPVRVWIATEFGDASSSHDSTEFLDPLRWKASVC